MISRATAVLAAAVSFLAASPAAADAPPWMHVDAAHKTVHFDIKMAEDGGNGTLNFNGYAKGALTLTVPTGWHVTMHVSNAGAGAIPHSLEVLPISEAIPSQGVEPPAFSGAETIDLIPGLNPGQGDDVDFVADRPGKFWIFCGVPGHGVSGMWDYLVVSASAPLPSVTETKS
jgi:sulfocyanin